MIALAKFARRAMAIKLDGLSLRHWRAWGRCRVRRLAFRFLFRRIYCRPSLFWACVAALFFLNDRERDYLVRRMEESVAILGAMGRRAGQCRTAAPLRAMLKILDQGFPEDEFAWQSLGRGKPAESGTVPIRR